MMPPTIHSHDDEPLYLDDVGFELTFDNLTAEVEAEQTFQPGLRSQQQQDVIDTAAPESDMEILGTVSLMDQQPEVEDDKAVLLKTSMVNTDHGRLLLYVDGNGQVSIHLPEIEEGAGVRGFGSTAAFNIPLRPQYRPDDMDPEERGPGGWAVRSLLKLLGWKVAGAAAATYGPPQLRKWENRVLSKQILDWPQLFAEEPQTMMTPIQSSSRSLLFIHGTFSRVNKAFHGLDNNQDFLDSALDLYGPHIYGYNHPTIATGIATNIMQLYDHLASGKHRFDIICHSRGGLVARALRNLTESQLKAQFEKDIVRGNYDQDLRDWGRQWKIPKDVEVQVERIIFGGSPNCGTILAKKNHLKRYLEILLSAVTLGLPDPFEIVLSGVLEAAKLLAADVLPSLPGLADQSPESELIQILANKPESGDAAIRANFEPGGVLSRVGDGLWDSLFKGEDNDVLVTMDSVAAWPDGGFEPAQILSFGASFTPAVWHSSLFAQEATTNKILEWLSN